MWRVNFPAGDERCTGLIVNLLDFRSKGLGSRLGLKSSCHSFDWDALLSQYVSTPRSRDANTDELTSVSCTCRGSKSYSFNTLMVWELGEALAGGTNSAALYMQGDFPKYVSSFLQIFDNKGKGKKQ